MSRTYRVRHLPALRAKKFIDAKGGYLTRRRREEIDRLVENLYPETRTKRYSKQYFRQWNFRWTLSQKLDDEFCSPVLSYVSHPWVSWSCIGRCKAWYKQHGNQRTRAHNRLMLKNEDYDGEFFGKLHGWDIWSIT